VEVGAGFDEMEVEGVEEEVGGWRGRWWN